MRGNDGIALDAVQRFKRLDATATAQGGTRTAPRCQGRTLARHDLARRWERAANRALAHEHGRDERVDEPQPRRTC